MTWMRLWRQLVSSNKRKKTWQSFSPSLTDKNREAVRIGQRAAELLADEVLIKALDEIHADAVKSLVLAHDEKLWPRYWHTANAVAQLRAKLETFVSDGRQAKRDLEPN